MRRNRRPVREHRQHPAFKRIMDGYEDEDTGIRVLQVQYSEDDPDYEGGIMVEVYDGNDDLLDEDLGSYRDLTKALKDAVETYGEARTAALRSGLIRLAHDLPKGSPRSALLHVLAGKTAEKWIQDAIKHPGRLNKYFGIPEEDDIPMSKLRDEAKKLKDKGDKKTDEEKSLQKAINMAITLKSKVNKAASGKVALRSEVIRMAYVVPELRARVLPLLKVSGHEND